MNRISNLFKKSFKSHRPRFIGLVVFYLCVSIFSYAGNGNKTHKMNNIKGEYIGGKNMSPEEVENKAIEEAKRQALVKAGISENIASYQNLFKIEASGKYEEVFSSDILADIQGAVVDIEPVGKPERIILDDGGFKVIVTINCTVVEYENKRDLTFDVVIDGMKPVYENNSGMKFTVTPAKDSYARIFFISDKSESSMIFPSEYEKDMVLKGGQTYTFPDQNKFENYPVSTDLQTETYKLIFVLLKENIPFTDVSKVKVKQDKEGNYNLASVSFKKLFDWIYQISPDQRCLKTFSVTVHK